MRPDQSSFRSDLPEARSKALSLDVSARTPIEIRIIFCRPSSAVGHDVGCVGGISNQCGRVTRNRRWREKEKMKPRLSN